MNKKFFTLIGFSLVLLSVLVASCSSNTYANQLKDERKQIKQYIEREQIRVLSDAPQDGQWGEKDYVLIDDDGLYFHQEQLGDTLVEPLSVGDQIVLRYKKYSLDAYSDTISNWSTNDSGSPLIITYNGSYATSQTTDCEAWQQAFRQMRYHESKAKIICPSKLGFESDGSSVTPYGYELYILIKKF